ncbi:LOW QUALITY PROTEIN: alpha-2-macroglobulin-like [Hyperolius riggenbachi]|uniref:LOW QUALITY PROTEIN: alpha-2-macroglobulin-like n=1 Tax=Hyperolius riggenbachi TaxID=752182 RepID=UPI0035A2D5E1
MWSSALGLCLFLSAIYGGEPTTPEPQYMLLVPPVLKAGHEQKFCLQLSHLNDSLSVTVALEAEENVTLLEREVTNPEEDNCFPFKTPDVESAKVAYITLNAVGDTLHFRTKRSVLIRPLYNLVFIQTDKPIYKPGQTVQFRVASLDEDFRATNEKFPVIYIQDPQRNRISQWVNVETRRGIAQESFLLAAEPRMGTYTVVAQREKGSQIEQTFTVEEYVLPKYDVQVKMPSVITILDEAVPVTICGKYTYGKPVSGKIDVRVCRKFQRYASCAGAEDRVCEELSKEADHDGCFSEVVKTKLFQLKRNGYDMKLTATAKITEDGTGVELSGEASSEIKTTIAKASFRQLDSHFKRGIPLFGQIFLEDAAGKPLSNKTVTLFVGSSGTNFTYTTGPDGTADFSVDTKSFHSSINLRVSYKTVESCYSQWSQSPRYEEESRNINHFYSRSESFLKIQPIYRTLKCPEEERLLVHYTLTPKGAGENTHAEFYHLIMSKGAIVSSGKHKVELNATGESHGQFTLTLPVTVKTAPLAKVLVYTILDKGEVIADRVDFTVEKCFENQVQLSLSNKEVLPGSSTNLVISSVPNSLCALRGVDSSVLLLKPEAELSADSVYKLLQVTDLSGYNHDGHYLEEPSEEACLKLEPIFLNGVYYQPTLPPSEVDAYTILKEFGLKVATNTLIRIPRPCQGVHTVSYGVLGSGMRAEYLSAPMAMRGGMRQYSPGAAGPDGRAAEEIFIESVRKFFPETFLWDLVEIEDIGQTTLKLTAPDSITTWKVGAFCMSEEVGFGQADTISMLTFQPFFLDLTMPYSAVRGEKFILKTSVFNYLKETIRVKITLEGSDKYMAENINEDDEGYCIDANGRVTIDLEVILQSLGEVDMTVSAQTMPGGGLCGNEIVDPAQGRKDTITKHILVEAEGVEKEETHSAMICNTGSDTTEKISLKLPEQVVEGSGRAHFSVIGDIMGTAMQNLGNLLQMPSGCGEQNIALFTPNIYVLEYLNSTGQLTPDLKSKALTHLNTGYQRQLMYKQPDGSYSVFGSRFSQANTWLTAFVLRSFARAQSHIFIDPKHISDSLAWLSQRQKENGCFQNIGNLFNNALQGGVNDEVALAAYITITLLEMHRPVTDVVVRNAFFCLESALQGDLNIYTKALMAYAFTLAGKMDIRSQLLHSLDEKAIKQEGTIHWHRPEVSEGSGKVWTPSSRAPSLEIEMTSYILLAMLHKPELTNEDLTHATKVVSWIIKQQNPNGGFTSTQDTVVALQALATYGHHAHKHDGPREVAVTAEGAPVANLHVDDTNRLLLQRATLPNVPGDYSVSISGPGCVFIQSVLKYNVPPPEGDAPFALTVTTVPQECSAKSIKGFSIAVNVSYTGSRDNSNMAIVDVKLPSGFSPVKSSVRQLTSNSMIKMATSEPNKVIVYYEKLTKDVQTFMFSVEQDIPMSNLRPATASVYDYYETGDYAVTKYSAPCS